MPSQHLAFLVGRSAPVGQTRRLQHVDRSALRQPEVRLGIVNHKSRGRWFALWGGSQFKEWG